MSKSITKTTDKILSFLFPLRCPYCFCVLKKDECICKKCKKHAPPFGVSQGVYQGYRCCSPLVYNGRFKKAVLAFKFRRKPQFAPLFAQLIYKQINTSYNDFIFDCITYVPMYTKDEKKRGYNQSELLAKELSKLMGIECVALLKKIKHTKPQHNLSAKLRKTNLKGAFKPVDTSKIKGKSILLIDDIITTGSTFSECIKTLEKEKPSHICCATLLSTVRFY